MQAINYHEKFHSSTEGLNAALKKVKQHRQVIAETRKRRKGISDQRESIALPAQEAEREVQIRRDALMDSLGTPDEERALASIAQALATLQGHTERLAAFDSKEKQVPDQYSVQDSIEALRRAKKEAMGHLSGEVMKSFPKDAVRVLHSAYAVYTGFFGWEEWLKYVIPYPIEAEINHLRNEVAASFGLDLTRRDEV
jgi:hypothetical protein